jgi:hypothetical protein
MESKMNLARLESKKQWLAEEAARFYERSLGLRDAYVEYLDRVESGQGAKGKPGAEKGKPGAARS